MSTESLSANQVANLLKAMETAHGDKTAHGDMDSIAEQRQSARRDAGKADIGDAGDGEAAPGGDGTALPDTDRRAPAVSSDVGAAADGPPATDRQPVTPYDFQRPDRVDNDLLQALWSLHETIAGSFAAAISHLLRTPLDVKLRSIDQLVYSEFVTSREKPSCLSVIKPAPLDGNWMVDVAPSLAFAVIDRMLGGDPIRGATIRRPLTEIENRLISRVVTLFLDQIAPAWQKVVLLQPVLESIDSTPHRAPVATPNETVIEVRFEVAWGENRDMMTLCMPSRTLEPVRDKLTVGGGGDRSATDATRRQIARSVDAAKVDLVVTLARSRIKTSDLLGLSVGDIITTEQEIEHPLELAIQDIPKFHATAGAYKGKKAIQIQSTMDPHRPGSDAGDA